MPNVLDLRNQQPTPEEESHHDEYSERTQGGIVAWVGVDTSSKEKTAEWYVVLAIFVIAFVFIGVIFSNFLLSLLAIMSGAALTLVGSRKPFEVHATITAEGIIVEDKLHRYEDLKSFWVFYEPPYLKELSLTSKKAFATHIRIPLGDANPALIHETLVPFLKEIREEESFADILSRRIGL